MADKKPAMKFSLSLGAKKQTAGPATFKRPAPALKAFEEEVEAAPTAQAVSAFDAAAGGAIDTSKPLTTTGPVVIAPQANRDWRAESRKKQRGRLPDGARQENNATPANEELATPQIAFGLTVVKPQKGEAALEQTADNKQEEEIKDPEKPTDDQLAMQALLGERPESTLVLNMDEDTVFQNDFSKAPPAPSLEDYAKVAIEDFGAAYLRGFGWKGDNSLQKNSKPEKRPVRRSALLGIGAKEEAAVGIELGEWGKATKGKRKVDQAYNPVLLLNKETGEKLTEEELKTRIDSRRWLTLCLRQNGRSDRHLVNSNTDPLRNLLVGTNMKMTMSGAGVIGVEMNGTETEIGTRKNAEIESTTASIVHLEGTGALLPTADASGNDETTTSVTATVASAVTRKTATRTIGIATTATTGDPRDAKSSETATDTTIREGDEDRKSTERRAA